MTQSSRYRSHKQHKHGKGHSDSEEEEKFRERKSIDEFAVSSRNRTSRVTEMKEKRKISSVAQRKDVDSDKDDGKIRKIRENSPENDRWDGGEGKPSEGLILDSNIKGEVRGIDLERSPKSKVSANMKSRSSRRGETLNERREVENVSSKEKDSRKRESERREGHHYGSEKRDRREKSIHKEHKAPLNLDEGSKPASRVSDFTREPPKKGEKVTIELELRSSLSGSDKELQKKSRKRDSHRDKDGDHRKISSKVDHIKSGRYKEDKHKDTRCQDKSRDSHDRDIKYHDDNHRDVHNSKNYVNDDYYNTTQENQCKKAKFVDDDQETTRGYYGRETKSEMKTSINNENCTDAKSQKGRECPQSEKNASYSDKFDSDTNKERSKPYILPSNVSDVIHSSRRWRSPTSNAIQILVDDQPRDLSKVGVGSPPGERARHSTSSRKEEEDDLVIDNASKSVSMEKNKQKSKAHSGNLLAEEASNGRGTRSPSSVCYDASPFRVTERSPSSTSGDRQYSSRVISKQNVDADELTWKKDDSKESKIRFGIQEKQTVDDFYPPESMSNDFGPKTSGPTNLPPPYSHSRHGIDSSEEDSKILVTDRKSNIRSRRGVDPTVGRSQESAWKGMPNWSSPATNGFMPFPLGPSPSVGFHPLMSQFHSSPLFGIRPSIDLMHSNERFPVQGHPPYGWRPSDESYLSQLNGWVGSSTVYGDGSHLYQQSDWNQRKQNSPMQNPSTWKDQHTSTLIDSDGFPIEVMAQKDFSGNSNEQNKQGDLSVKHVEIKQSDGVLASRHTVEVPKTLVQGISTKSTGVSNNNDVTFCNAYLSKLDISSDLAEPKLYKRCVDLLEVKGNEDRAKTYGYRPKGNKLGPHLNFSFQTTLLPPASEETFKKAMTWYKHSVASEVKEKDPILSAENINTKMKISSPQLESNMEKESHPNKETVGSSGEDIYSINEEGIDKKVDSEPCKNNDATGNHSNLLSEGNKTCKDNEAVEGCSNVFLNASVDSHSESIEETKLVNLSRIPNSLESTH